MNPFLPKAPPLSDTALEALVDLLKERRVAVLTGAGCSTESGIPDYRGPKTRAKARNPVQYKAFVDDARARSHYWARSMVGWPRMAGATPNPGHYALAAMEAAGLITGIITQNVDRLHQKAGSQHVVELHGALGEVRCLSCGRLVERTRLQRLFQTLNPDWMRQSAELAPDGDAEVPRHATEGFRVPDCISCSGVLKPNVVFFGENVPKHRVDAAWEVYQEADVLLVAGSSLAVYSGYRFVLKAHREHKAIGMVNLGEPRGSDKAQVHVAGRFGDVLPRLAERLGCAVHR